MPIEGAKPVKRYTPLGFGWQVLVHLMALCGAYLIVWDGTTKVLDELEIVQRTQRIFWHVLVAVGLLVVAGAVAFGKRLWDTFNDNPHPCLRDEQNAKVIREFAGKVLPGTRIRRSSTVHVAIGFGAKICLLDHARSELQQVLVKQLNIVAKEICRQKEYDANAIDVLSEQVGSILMHFDRFKSSLGNSLGFVAALNESDDLIGDRIEQESDEVRNVFKLLRELVMRPPANLTSSLQDFQKYMVDQGGLVKESAGRLNNVAVDLHECAKRCRLQCGRLSQTWALSWDN